MSVHRAYVATTAGQLHYRYAGKPGRPVIVLLHQTPSTSEMYEDLMQALADEFRLVAPDTPGMGMSDAVGDTMSIARSADVIAEALDELGITRCYVFGHHTGAAIAAELAARMPSLVIAAALSGPPLLSEDLKAKLPAMAAIPDAREDGSHVLEIWQRFVGKDGKAPLAIALRESINAFQAGPRYADAYKAVAQQDFAAIVAAIRCPTLVFAGTEDILFDAVDGTLALLENGHKATIDGARSYVCETHCDEVAALLRQFFPLQEAA